MAVPDALSRLPASTTVHDVTVLPDLEGIPLTPFEIAQETAKDPILSKVLEFVLFGWPEPKSPMITDALRPFYHRRSELTVLEKCLLRGNRVVIPTSLRAHVLKILHLGHTGVVRTKMLARSKVYWMNMDDDIEAYIGACQPCKVVNFKPSPDLLPWPATSYPFERVHMDFCQLQGHLLHSCRCLH